MMTRNAEGEVVTVGLGGEKITAKIPTNRTALGLIATNGLVDGAEYKENGWVYFDGKEYRKWHVMFQNIRIWEPKFSDLKYLYGLYKKTQVANSNAWNTIREILNTLWKTRRKGQRDVIAHAKPTHQFEWQEWRKEPWWEFKVSNHYPDYGLSFSFDWLEGKPKKLVNHELGEKLYYLEQRWYNNTSRRAGKVRTIFFEAMKRSLPKANEDRVICLKFGEDSFWFYTKNNGPKAYWWEMFDDKYEFEIKNIL